MPPELRPHALPLGLMRAGRFAVVSLFLTVSTLRGAEVTVHLVAISTDACKSGIVRVNDVCGGADCPQQTLPWRRVADTLDLSINVADDSSSTLVVEGPGCWAAPLIVASNASKASNASNNATMALWPAGTIAARISVPEGAPMPLSLALRLQSVPGATSALAEANVDCPVKDGRIHCAAPATTLDLRLATDTFAPHYEWGLSLARGGTRDLGEIRLHAGGSVSGYVAYPVKGADPKAISVELAPWSFSGTTSPVRDAALRRRTNPNARGFFQFHDLEPGAYSIVASSEGWSPVFVEDVRVGGPRETSVKTLTVEPRARLAGTIDPALDPEGKPWKVTIGRSGGPSASPPPESTTTASAAGYYSFDKIERGGYVLRVEDAHGSRHHVQFIIVRDDEQPLQIILTETAVQGAVTFDDEPIAGRVVFRAALGERVEMVAGDDGGFRGTLPHPGRWKPEVTPRSTRTMVRPGEVDVHRVDGERAVRVDLRLPAGRVHGVTVSEDGKPVHATVYVQLDGETLATAIAGDDGAFDFIGVAPGDVSLRGRNVDGDSGLLPHHVAGTGDPATTLPVPRNIKIEGWIVTPDGRPVAGAILRCYPELIRTQREEITGPSGEFSFKLPARQTEIDASIVAPGLPVKLVHLEAGQPQEIVMGNASGQLLVSIASIGGSLRWPLVRFASGALVSLLDLLPPFSGGPWPELTRDGLLLRVEPGPYTICPERRGDERCATAVVGIGVRETIDARAMYR